MMTGLLISGCLALWSKNKFNYCIYNSNLSKMRKHSFPPSHTFVLDVKCGEDLVWPVNCIHFQVLSLKNLRLSNNSFCWYSSIPYLPGHLDVVISIAHSSNHGRDLIIYPLKKLNREGPSPRELNYSLQWWWNNTDLKESHSLLQPGVQLGKQLKQQEVREDNDLLIYWWLNFQ